MLVDRIAFATIAKWRSNRSTAGQQRNHDKTKYCVQRKSPTAPIQIVSKGAQSTCDAHHICICGWGRTRSSGEMAA
jgi:6-phosphogluconolactonase/glucosamine-6-phosphate isomerase/deaminase